MSSARLRRSVLLSFTGLLLASAVLARGQSAAAPLGAGTCADQLRKANEAESHAVISVRKLRISPHAWKHYQRALLADQGGSLEDFERETEAALALEPLFLEIHLMRASREIRERHYTLAEREIKEARRIEPANTLAAIQLAGLLSSEQRYAEAASELREIHPAPGERWQWLFEQTRVALGIGRPEEALRWSEATLAASPPACVEAHLLRGDALVIAGRKAEAVAQFEGYLSAGLWLPQRREVQELVDRLRRTLLAKGDDVLTAAK